MIDRAIKVFFYLVKFFWQRSILKSDKYFDVLHEALSDLGGLYVKLVQFICLRTDVFSDAQKLRFLSFYDAVPFERIDMQKTIMTELGHAAVDCFRFISTQPFASGTFGQVYKGELVDGTEVVIKVKRGQLNLKLKFDFFLVKIAAQLFNLFYYQKIVDVNNLISEFEAMTYQELNYEKETLNANYFYDLYENHPHVLIPKTFVELCTKNVIVQEYIGGISVTDMIRMKINLNDEDYRKWLQQNLTTDLSFVLRSLVIELGLQGLVQEKFYADPHPGNVKILPNNHYALIDFGIVGTSPLNKRSYYSMLQLIVKKAESMDMQKLGETFLEWGATNFYRYLETLDDYFSQTEGELLKLVKDKYARLLEEKRERFREIELLEQENFTKLYFHILEAGQNLNVKLPQGMLAVLRTISVYKSWHEYLEPELHQMRDTYRDLLGIVDKQKLLNEEQLNARPIPVEEALENMLDWLGGVAENDPPFYQRLSREIGTISYV